MSSDKVPKIAVISFVFFACMYFAIGGAIGPGNKDFSTPLIANYFYEDAGHFEKMITFSDGKSRPKIIIDARVDDYRINENVIYVARRPRDIYQEQGVTHSRVSDNCEYWLISTLDSVVKQVGKINDLHCK